MPAPAPSSFAAQRRYLLGAGLVAASLGATASAADVLVVTDRHHPVHAGGARIIELDRPARIEAELTTGLPAEPAAAAALVKRRLADGGPALQRRIAAAYQDVVEAWALGVTTIPAVVVDRQYVVYGEPAVDQAVARIALHRRTQP